MRENLKLLRKQNKKRHVQNFEFIPKKWEQNDAQNFPQLPPETSVQKKLLLQNLHTQLFSFFLQSLA